MNTSITSRVGAATGAVFAIVLFVAAGNGSESYSAPRAMAGLAALALFIPFVAYICSALRAAQAESAWLTQTALAAGVTGITLKIVSTVPELALHRAHVADGTALHRLVQSLGDGATVIALFPLAIFCAATAIVAFRTTALPRWLAAFAAVTAVALTVNGAFLEASFVPALLLFMVWTLAASVHLVRSAGRASAGVRRIEPLAGN
jgi:predicted neutral ceramidase superfamily lipid hydrolase